MNAIDTLLKIAENQHIVDADLKYCLVNADKRPYKPDGTPAKPNQISDFVSIEELCQSELLNKFVGIGISVQASNICAIDVDDCFSRAFDVKSADERAITTIKLFEDVAYIEFSFSGKGLRVLFRQTLISDYSSKYYIKNDKNHIEYYQPSASYRYVTLTGQTIIDNPIQSTTETYIRLNHFLELYMVKKIVHHHTMDINSNDDTPIEKLLIRTKKFYIKNHKFQDLWFGQAPGSGSNESQLDHEILALLFENITQDKEKLRLLFEASPYFASKDMKHKRKWSYQNYRYLDFMYQKICESHS